MFEKILNDLHCKLSKLHGHLADTLIQNFISIVLFLLVYYVKKQNI